MTSKYAVPFTARDFRLTRFQWIQFDATTAEVEDLLFTDYFYWEHGPTGSENIAAEEYHIPSNVQTHIDCK